MRIVIDLTSLYDHLTGIERYAMEMSGNLMKQFPEHEYILLFKNEIHKEYKAGGKYSLRLLSGDRDNIRYKILKGKNKLIFNQISILKAIKKVEADAYYFPAFPEPILFNNKNIFTTIHDMGCFDCPDAMTLLSGMYFRTSYKHAFRKAKRVLTISDFSKNRIIDVAKGKVSENRIKVIYAGVNEGVSYDKSKIKAMKPILEEYGIKDDYILSLSTLEPRKNLSLLIKAYAKLVEKDRSVPSLVLAGRMGWKMENFLSGYSEEVLNKIIITGFIRDEDLPVLYGNARFFVFPSKYEGFGIPPLEALVYGASVLSSDAASMPEVLGDAALYFESENEDSLINNIEKMLALNDKEKERMADEGQSRVKMFTWEKEVKKLIESFI